MITTASELRERFPHMFAGTRFELPPGWLGIFAILCEQVNRELSEVERQQFRWIQVKEKFGMFRGYHEGVTNKTLIYVETMVNQMESLSVNTCQVCGQPGHKRVEGGCVRTSCNKCLEIED